LGRGWASCQWGQRRGLLVVCIGVHRHGLACSLVMCDEWWHFELPPIDVFGGSIGGGGGVACLVDG